MKRLSLLFISIAGLACMQAQTLMTVDPATEYQTIVGLGVGNSLSADATAIKFIYDFLGCSETRHWIEINDCNNPTVTVANINSGTVVFTSLTPTAISFYNSIKTKGVKVISSCFSPPACLKANNCIQQRVSNVCCAPCPTYNCADDLNYLLPQYYDEYARYLALWAKDFQTKTGISLYGLGIQNEPLFNEPYGSSKLFSFAYGPALKAVHDTFAKYPELSGIKFCGPEHMCTYGGNNGGQGVGSNYIKALLDSTTYRPYLDVYAVHGYSDGIAPDLGSSAEWEAFYNKVTVEHGKELWMTETEIVDASWTASYWYMKCFFMAFKSGKISLWSYNSLSYLYGSGNATRQFYNNMHFFRFIRPGMKMIKVTDTDADVECIGFKSGSDVTVVAINISKTTPKSIQFSDFAGKPAFYHVYRSTSMEMCSYVGKVTDNTFQLPAESVATITYNSTSPNLTYGPLAPTNLTATKIADNSITVTWTPATSWTLNGSPVTISGYVVYINGVKKTMTPISGSTYSFTGLKAGTKYTIEVYTRDAMINQSVAATLQVTTTCDVGGCVPDTTDNIDVVQLALSVSPNPSSNMVTVEMPDNNIYNLVIIDITGKTVVFRQNVSGKEIIDVSSLPNGIYIVIANNGEKIYKAKVAVE